jgi:hypothetical protein
MKTLAVFALPVLAAGAVLGLAQDKPPAAAPLGAIEVQLPEGDLRMFFVEAAGGMELLLQTGDSHVQARRLFLGDGKVAVAY